MLLNLIAVVSSATPTPVNPENAILIFNHELDVFKNPLAVWGI